ncbi:hypothetical protein [Nocardioides bruguierae]|uniref:Uncharacterized protein n=1 Tax=Nocardioides bruguierae TaxID=2945102 RepID=A0A9X2D4M4_9ACTN|nr:hypothetical protein [Nocardioides bruguierae]MCM0618752.1 hypothetical protein [Nocardioides bruguierae]
MDLPDGASRFRTPLEQAIRDASIVGLIISIVLAFLVVEGDAVLIATAVVFGTTLLGSRAYARRADLLFAVELALDDDEDEETQPA